MAKGVKKTMLLKELQEGSNTQALWSDKNGVGSGYAKAGVKRGLGLLIASHR